MKKQLIFLTSLTIFLAGCSAQLRNYDLDGKKNLITEKIKMEVIDRTDDQTRNAAGILPSVISAFSSVAVDVVKTAVDNRQQSYTATYTQNYSGFPLLNGTSLKPKELIITRYTREEGKTTDDIAAKYCLSFDNSQISYGIFRLSLDTVIFIKSKARVSGSELKKSVNVSLDITITATYRDSAPSTGNSTGNSSAGTAQTPTKVNNNFALKSANLGESIITYRGLSPSTNPYLKDNLQNLYSDWYQIVPQDPDATQAHIGAYTIKVTVNEANPYALKSGQLNDFLKTNSSDIGSFIKSFFSTSSSSSSSKTGN